ncbi:MAG: transglutaminase-like domain-containing protein [Kofleriaceae bacterium]
MAPWLHCTLAMRWALVAICACAPPHLRQTLPPIAPTTGPPQGRWPSLEPAGRTGAAPIDPYAADDLPLREVTDDHVLSDVVLGDPGAVTTMVVRVDTGDYALPTGPNHVVEREGALRRVTIRRIPGGPVTDRERADALRAADRFDLATAAIRRTARVATSGARTDRARVAALVTWIHTNITYVLSDETVASRVLARGSGDCSEMSMLFIALARASNLPARRVVGLAATEADGASAFGFHAWAEVALDGHWVSVDPTWDEPVADATHVAILVGDSDDWTRAIPGLRLAVVDLTRDASLAGRAGARQLVSELPEYMRLTR